MDILADENVPGAVVVALRDRGHDVAWIAEMAPGVVDVDVASHATGSGRLLITFDKDFGALAFQSKVVGDSGIVLFRVSAPSPAALARRVVGVIESRNDWSGCFAVVEPGRLRIRRLPEPRQPSPNER